MDIKNLTEEIFLYIKKTKYKFISTDSISSLIKEKVGDEYTSEIGIAVKNELLNHEQIEFFREGDYIHEMKYYFCTGNWIAVKGAYSNPVEAKIKMGWYSWQTSKVIDFEGC